MEEMPFRSTWSNRRSATAPPSLLKETLGLVDRHPVFGHIRVPETAEVRRQLSSGGHCVTVRDVALCIVRRLLDCPGNDASEVLFLGECLKAGASCTALPCHLLRRGGDSIDRDALGDYLGAEDVQTLLRTRENSPRSVPSRPVSASGDAARSSSGLAAPNQDDRLVPRWPVAVPSGVEQELEPLFGRAFHSWGLDMFELSRVVEGRELQFVGWESLRQGDYFSVFGISPGKAQRFLERVQGSYASSEVVPYHNSRHAADVTQSVNELLRKLGFIAFFEPLATLALILSALVHDMGHDGKTNLFHINVQDELALTYNDRSVLENFHVAEAFKILSANPDANLLDVFEKERRNVIRKDMIDNVLSTDMSLHFRTVETLKNFVERLDTNPASWAAEAGALGALQVMLLHTADIGNMGKTPVLADRWTELLKKEFFAQGDEERAMGLPISPLCDRVALRFAGPQVGFIRVIVRPTFDVVASLAPLFEEIVLRDVQANMDLWESRKAVEEAELGAHQANAMH